MEKQKLIRTTLLNIDSSFRDTDPKNVYTATLNMSPNSLYFTKDSNIVKINYPNHGLSIGDRIIIQNTQGSSTIVANSLYLFNEFNYLMINYKDIKIPINYKNYTNDIFINIEIYDDITMPSIINNIQINNFMGIQKIYVYSDISSTIPLLVTNYCKTNNIDINNDVVFIKLPFNYTNINNDYVIINQVFKISIMNIAGIPLGYINANYPINNYNYQSYQTVSNVNTNDPNNFYIQLNLVAYNTINGGGSNMQIMKISDVIIGYPYANDYNVILKKTFTNVVNIKLISTEFPYVDLIVKNNINNKLYWQLFDDGLHEYSITVSEGMYSITTLIDTINKQLNTIERINSTSQNPIFNIFNVTCDVNTHKIIFNSYQYVTLYNALSVDILIIDNIQYYTLIIKHDNNYVKVGDTISISNANNVTVNNNDTYITPDIINDTFTVYSINTSARTYTVILGNIDNIFLYESDQRFYGGVNTQIKLQNKFSLLFNKSDTIGDILGFKNSGDKYAITPFQTTITNYDQYVYSNNLNSIGNLVTTNNFINLAGNYNYILMYLNNIEYINLNNNLDAAFAKILLSGKQGDILFNTFVAQNDNIYAKIFPIITLSFLSIKFLFPDGSSPDFRNINHSFTLRIDEEYMSSSTINLNSNHVPIYEEMKKLNV
jgi:hypothetical protein